MAEPRKVRCPKCSSLLTEPAEEAVYTCGVCSTFLQAKRVAARNGNLQFINSDKVYAVTSEMSSCQSEEEESSSESELAGRRRRVSASREVWKNRDGCLEVPPPLLNPPLNRKNIDCLENTQSSIHNDDDDDVDDDDYDDFGDGNDGSFYAASDHTGEASDCSLDRFAMDSNTCHAIDISSSKKVEVVVESVAMDSSIEDMLLMKKVEGVVASMAMDSSIKDVPLSKKVEGVVALATMESSIKDIPLMKKVEGVDKAEDIPPSKTVEGVDSAEDIPWSKKVEGVDNSEDIPPLKKVEGVVASAAIDSSVEDVPSSKKVEGVVESVAMESSMKDIPSSKKVEGVVASVAMDSSVEGIPLSKKVEGVVALVAMECLVEDILLMKEVEGVTSVEDIPFKKVKGLVESVAMDSSVEDIPLMKNVEGLASIEDIPRMKKVEGVISTEDILSLKKVEGLVESAGMGSSVKDILLIKKVEGVVESVAMDSSVEDIPLMKNVEGVASVEDMSLVRKVEGVASTDDIPLLKKVEGIVESVGTDFSVKDIPLMKKVECVIESVAMDSSVADILLMKNAEGIASVEDIPLMKNVEGVASTEDILSLKRIEGIVESVALSVKDIPLMKKVDGVVESVAMDSSIKDIPLTKKDEAVVASVVMESSVEDILSPKKVEGVVVMAAMESSVEDILSLKNVEGVVVTTAMESSVEDIPLSEKAKGVVAGAIESSISEIWTGADHEDGDFLALSAPSFRDFSEISYTALDGTSIHTSSTNFQSSDIYHDQSSGDEVDLTGSTRSRIIEEESVCNIGGIVNRSIHNNNNLILSNDLLSFSSFCESMGKSSADKDLKSAQSLTERYQMAKESQIDDAVSVEKHQEYENQRHSDFFFKYPLRYVGDFPQVRGTLSTTDDAKDSVNHENRRILHKTTANTNVMNSEVNENHASPSFEIFSQHRSEHSKAGTIDDSQMEMHGMKSMWSFDRKTANSTNRSGSPFLEDSDNSGQSQSGQGHSSVRPCQRGDERHEYERVFMKESRQDEESFPNYSNLRVGNTSETHGKPWRRDIATHMRLHTDYQANITEAKGLQHHPFSSTANRDSATPSSPSPTIGGRITPLPPPMYTDHPMNSCPHNPPICTLCLSHLHTEHQHCHCPVCSSSSNSNGHSSLQMLAYSGFLQQQPPPMPHPHWSPYSGHHSHPPTHHYAAPHTTSYRPDSGSAPFGAKLLRPTHREKQRRKRYPLLPKDGAAPFVLCWHCFQLLEVPMHRLSSVMTTVQKLRCGACLKILRFSVHNDEKLDISPENRLNALNHISNPVLNSRLLYTTSSGGGPLLGNDSIMPESDMNSWGAQPPPLLAFHGRRADWSNEMPDQLNAGDFEQIYYPRNPLLLGDLNSSWQSGAIPKNRPTHGQGNPVYVNRNQDQVFPQKADYHGDYPQHGDLFNRNFQSGVGLSSLHENFNYQDPQSCTRSQVKGLMTSQQLKQVDYLDNGRFASAYPSACLDEQPIYGSLHSGGTSRDGSSNGRSPAPGSPLHEHLTHDNLLLDCDASLFDTKDSLGGRGVGVSPKEGNRKALKSSTSLTGFLKRSFKDRTKGSRGVTVSTSSSPSRRVIVNGQVIPEVAIRKAEESAGVIESGSYWYDYRAGFWGAIGGPCNGIIPAMIKEFHYPMMRNCAGGMTRVLVNGRELHQKDLDILVRRGLPKTPGKAYIIDISGRVADETTGQPLQSLGKLAPSIEKTGRGSGMFQSLHN